jgi:hypothetical protein
MADLKSELLFEMSADLDATSRQELAHTPHGTRRIVSGPGGVFEGPKLKGVLLPGGGDWLLVRPDGASELDVRTTLQTDDGHLIYMSYRGILYRPPAVMERMRQGERDIDPSEYYCRTTPVFETGSEKYDWLNRIISVGVGRSTQTGVAYTVYAIL